MHIGNNGWGVVVAVGGGGGGWAMSGTYVRDVQPMQGILHSQLRAQRVRCAQHLKHEQCILWVQPVKCAQRVKHVQRLKRVKRGKCGMFSPTPLEG